MSSVGHIQALVLGLPEHKQEYWLIVPLVSYADDSGSDPQSHTFVLAGFIADAGRWVAFTKDWQIALDGPPKLDYFKMTEAVHLGGQFDKKRGWTNTKRDQKLAELIGIIKRHLRLAAYVSMRNVDFKAFVAANPLPGRRLATDHPYLFLFTQYILMLCEHGKQVSSQATFDFVFDEQQGFDVEATLWWPELKKIAEQQRLKSYLHSVPVFRNEKQFLPLQAADLLAWTRRNHLERNKLLYAPPTKVFQALNSIYTISVEVSQPDMRWIGERLLEMTAKYAAENPGKP